MPRTGFTLGLFVGATLALTASLTEVSAKQSKGKALQFSFEMADGSALPLNQFSGKPILVVNTATKCGFSKQLAGLQELHETYAARGLVVIAVPSNDFGNQEPLKDSEIAGFCEAKYGARYLMTAKTQVKGKSAHPFYRWAAETLGPAARPYWNFHKYLVGSDGSIIAWFSTPTKPTSPIIIKAIDAELDG
ncbi:glutathione peroxidase [Roseibium sp. HPY-6]|uniref:glutathione peroxidase n=1 Tax=Roseibium sp. HPY-6 TaxID=3229852 RepID=UPI00338FCD8D